MMDDFVYNIDTIAEDCYDLYVSDDAGYTWEFYGSYERKDWAVEDGEAAIWKAQTVAMLGEMAKIAAENDLP